MGSESTDLTLRNSDSHRADIWFWKASRTDPSGFADDKYQVFSPSVMKKSLKFENKHGTRYLVRKGDTGTSAYASTIPADFVSETLKNYKNIQPSGSRSDVRAKGKRALGTWTIEFSRKLKTNHDDDLAFEDLKKKYLFGVAVTEIAGRKIDKSLSNPFFGAGDVGEALYLSFGKGK